MSQGITNTVGYYLARTIPHFEDLFTTNFKITTYNVDTNNHIATVQTETPHGLVPHSCVVINNVKYGYTITSIKTVERKIGAVITNCIEIIVNTVLNINSIVSVDIKNIINNVALNSEFICYASELTEDDKTKIIGFYKDKTINIDNINITNEGSIFFNYTDSLFYNDNGNVDPRYDIISGFSIDYVSGAYNGYKVVKSIINENTFTISLAIPQFALRPLYTTLINIEKAVVKTDIKIYSSIPPTNEMMIDFISNMTENKESGALFLAKSETTSTSFGTQMTNDSITQNTPDDLIDENINFVCHFIFRVKKQDYGLNSSHYIVGHDANKISDKFNRVLKAITNRWFFEEEVGATNFINTNIAYKSYWNGGGTISNIDSSISNNLFYKMTFNFKITIRQSAYTTVSINQIGIPMSEVNLNLDYKNNDITNIKME